MSKLERNFVRAKITFKFRWDDTDDTFQDDDLLYSNMLPSQRRREALKADNDAITSFDRVSTKPLEKMTSRDWRIIRENYEINVKGGRAPPPMRTFRESPDPTIPKLHPALLDAIENVMAFKEPSPIQRQAIPVGLQRRDLIGIAETDPEKLWHSVFPSVTTCYIYPNGCYRALPTMGR